MIPSSSGVHAPNNTNDARMFVLTSDHPRHMRVHLWVLIHARPSQERVASQGHQTLETAEKRRGDKLLEWSLFTRPRGHGDRVSRGELTAARKSKRGGEKPPSTTVRGSGITAPKDSQPDRGVKNRQPWRRNNHATPLIKGATDPGWSKTHTCEENTRHEQIASCSSDLKTRRGRPADSRRTDSPIV